MTKLRGTNSVKPPVLRWMSRSSAMWRGYLLVGLHMPKHDGRSGGNAQFVGRSDNFLPLGYADSAPARYGPAIPGPATSAEVPGRLPTPASRRPSRYSRMVQRERIDPYSTSSGEKPWMCISGSASLIPLTKSDIQVPFQLWRQAGLDANLGSSVIPGLFSPAYNFVNRQEVAFFFPEVTAEGAKSAPLNTNIGKVNVPVNHIGNQVSHRAPA